MMTARGSDEDFTYDAFNHAVTTVLAHVIVMICVFDDDGILVSPIQR
jgi:hypothetical protein